MMQKLLWAECQKLRRSKIVWVTIFATVLVAIIVLVGGQTEFQGSRDLDKAGWYMGVVQAWATILVLPAVIALLGSYMICREEQEDTIKSLRLIPIDEAKLTAAKMIITLAFSILVYLLLFTIAFLAEAILHLPSLSVGMVLGFLKSYFLDGFGVFLAISPIIALVAHTKKSYWLALVIAEMYSFAGMFTSMSNTLKTFYPITALFGVSGYYETTAGDRMASIIVLLLCGCLSAFILKGLKHREES